MRNLLKSLIVFCFFIPVFAYCTLSNLTPDVTISGVDWWWLGGMNAGNGKFLVADGTGDTRLAIISPVPTANIDVDVAPQVKITGITQLFQFATTYPCLVGNKLFLSDSDPVNGYLIRVWNNIPTSNTTVASCDYKITGFNNFVYSLTSDGKSFACVSGSVVYIWENAPEANTDTSSVSAKIPQLYLTYNVAFGKNNKLYIGWNYNSTETSYVYIFKNMPVGPTSLNTADKKIRIYSSPSVGTYYNSVSAWENRGLYWISYGDVPSAKQCILIYKEFSNDSVTDTAGHVRKYLFSGSSAGLCGQTLADSDNIYSWNAQNQTPPYIFANDIGVLHTGIENVSPSYVYFKQQDVVMQKLKFYADGVNVQIDKIRFDFTGTATSGDVEYVKLYRDANNNETYDKGTDPQVGQTMPFSGASATFQGLALTASKYETTTLFVAIDMTETGTVQDNFGVKIVSDTYITLVYEKDYVWTGDFPLQSNLVTVSDSIPPDPITTLSAIPGTSEGEIELKWTRPYENIAIQKYAVVRADSKISLEQDFANATAIENSMSPSGNQEEKYTVKGLIPGRKYFFSIKTVDTLNNVSEISNSPFARAYVQTVYGKLYKADTTATDIIFNPLYPATTLSIPPGSLSSDVIVSMEKLDASTLSEEQVADITKHSEIARNEILALWEFTAIDPVTSEEKEVDFTSPVTVKISYAEKAPKSYEEENFGLAVYRWSETKRAWESKGGFIDKKNHAITVYTKKFSTYAVFVLKTDKNLMLKPNPFTPNRDGINDRVYFIYPESGKAKITVFDIDGRTVFYAGEAVSGETYWDGIDMNNKKMAETGYYICVVETSNTKHFAGLILSK